MTFRLLAGVLALAFLIQVAHQAEHVAQIIQIYWLAYRPPDAHGMLGSVFDLEWVHFAYNLALELMILAVWIGFRRLARERGASLQLPGWRFGYPVLTALVIFQGYHFVEHCVKMVQYYLYPYHQSGEHPPPGILPLVSGWKIFLVHFWFNMVVTAALALALWWLRPGRPVTASRPQRAARWAAAGRLGLGLVLLGGTLGGALAYRHFAPGRTLSAQSADGTQAPQGDLAPQLRDVAAEAGLDFRHGAFRTAVSDDPIAGMGGGLCWIDYDRDGWLDLYLVNSHAEAEAAYWEAQGGLPRNALYRNTGGRFTDVTEQTRTGLAQRGNGCVAADFNRDGWWDLFITAAGPDALLWNNGDGTFTEGGREAGIAAAEWNSAAAVADVNRDGWPDLFVGSYIDLNYKIPKPSGAFPQDYYGLADHLYLNEGPNAQGRTTFREVTRTAGLVREERTLGALFSDLDVDGDADLYVVNDGQPNRLYVNEPWPGGAAADPAGLGFRFVERTREADVGDSSSGMGVAAGDYDGDGWLDLFVTNWQRELHTLYRNEMAEAQDLQFQYSTFRIGMSGLGGGMTGWGTAWLDLDHDTDLDLLAVHGYVPVGDLAADAQRVRVYRNRTWTPSGQPERSGQFLEWTKAVGLDTVPPVLGRGSAAADYDNDGDLDIAVGAIGGPPMLLQNDGPSLNWLEVDLEGFFPCARVTVELADGRRLVRETYAGSSYLASEDPRLHFGLGTHESVAAVVVNWPDGSVTRLDSVAANQRVTVRPPP